jgi:tetratricopeptide (TPR) repeat protein
MSIPLDDTGSGRSDIVERFERQQKVRSALLVLGLLVLLGGGGGVLVAKFGPQGNPVQMLAARYGLVQPKFEDDGATAPIEQAQHAFDLDSPASLEKAQALFDTAQTLRPHDPMIPADRALAIVTRADQLRRIAADEEAQAAETERVRADYQALKAKADPATLPPEPKTADPAKLHQDASEKTAQASQLLQQAFDLARASFDLAPDGFEAARALAEYYRVQQDVPNYQRELARAKAALEKSRATDSAMLYVEAAAARMLSKPPNEDQAVRLLEQALTTRPSMNRARVLLARIYLARGGTTDVAKMELDRVLSSAPDHQEAQSLKDLALRIDRAKVVTTPAPPVQAVTAAEDTGPHPSPDSAAKQTPEDDKSADLKTHEGRLRAFNQYMQTGDRQREHDRPKLALAAYEKAADINPKSAEPLTGMGWAYIDMEKPEAALNVFKRAIRANDRYAEAYYGEAEAHRLMGQRDQAIEFYEKYLSRAPSGSDRRAAEKALQTLKNRP